MNELYDFLKKHIESGDCPISYIHSIFGERENYFELLMKDGSVITVKESYPNINKYSLCPTLKKAIQGYQT